MSLKGVSWFAVGRHPILGTPGQELTGPLIGGGANSGIFASVYDTIEPRARGTAAGIMNTVGWGGGALGPLFVGLAAKYGRSLSISEAQAVAPGVSSAR